MSKTKIGIIVCLVVLFILGCLLGYSYFVGNTDNNNLQNTDFLSSEEYFKDKNVEVDDDKIIIDGKIINRKNGYYLMNVGTGEEEFYCNFVGAVQKKLGVSYEGAVNVCLETIEGKIDFGVIHAVTNGNGTELSVNYNEKTRVIADSFSKFGEIKNLTDENVMYKNGSTLISNISYGITKSINLFSLCGYMSDEDKKVFTVKLYDEMKREIASQDYSFDSNKNFCVSFFDLNTEAAYYSFNEKSSDL